MPKLSNSNAQLEAELFLWRKEYLELIRQKYPASWREIWFNTQLYIRKQLKEPSHE